MVTTNANETYDFMIIESLDSWPMFTTNAVNVVNYETVFIEQRTMLTNLPSSIFLLLFYLFKKVNSLMELLNSNDRVIYRSNEHISLMQV